MPSITITITIAVPDDDPTNGGDFAADLTAHVLTHYADPTIHIDRTATHVATRLPQRVWDSTSDDDWSNMLAHQAKREVDRIYRYQVDEFEYDRVTSLDCPFCGAVAGKPCVKASGAAYVRPVTHSDRKRAYADREATQRAVAVVLDEVFVTYCRCGHGQAHHQCGFDNLPAWACVIDGCSCSDFVAIPASTDRPVM